MFRTSVLTEIQPTSVSNGRVGMLAPSPIAIDDLSKAFDGHVVVDGVSLSVSRGEVFGLIGPSGSGKSTLLKLMVGQAVPTSGQIRVLGASPGAFGPPDRERIGYVPQGFILYPTLTVEQNAKFAAGLYGLGWFERRRRVRETLELLELSDVRHRMASAISGGMQRRLALACGLLHNPELLFVDEPTAGLDPLLRTKIWDHLRHLAAKGVTIVVTTQYLDEAALCDRVAFLRGGRTVAVDTPEELRKRAIGGHGLDIEAPYFQEADAAALRELPGVRQVAAAGLGKVRVIVDDAHTTTAAISSLLEERHVQVTAIRSYEPSFDEVFVALAGTAEEER